MSRDVFVTLRPDTPNPIRMVVATDSAEHDFDRQQPAITDADMDTMRTGTPPDATREQVEAQVTSWFLAPEVVAVLGPVIEDRPFRIVINPDRKVESSFADVPFELARWKQPDYLLQSNNLTGLVYLASKRFTAQAPAAQVTKFRVLLVRAEPAHLLGTIPSGIALRHQLRAVIPPHGTLDVTVRLLSHEPGADGAPTREAIRKEIEARTPSVLLYLGHGDLLPGAPGAPLSPVLLIEKADGEQDELTAQSLRQLLKKHPVPLAVLAGCLTAAGNVRFNQSMAYSLVGGEGGVSVAIGMRYRVDVADATGFLQNLIGALFNGPHQGHVDLAVKAAREHLFFNNPTMLGWASPVVYRRALSEPLFPELISPGKLLVPKKLVPQGPDDAAARQQLSIIWSGMANLPANAPVALVDTFTDLLRESARSLDARLAERGIVGIIPMTSTEAQPPATTCMVELRLTADLVGVREVTFDLALRGAATWKSHKLKDTVTTAGFLSFITSQDSRLLTVLLRSATPETLTAGSLYEHEIELGPGAPSVVEISINGAICDTSQPIHGWVGAIIVRRQ